MRPSVRFAASYEAVVEADVVLAHLGHYVRLEKQTARDAVSP